MIRDSALLGLALLLLGSVSEDPADGDSARDHEMIRPLMGENMAARRTAQQKLIGAGRIDLVPGLVDAVFFTPRRDRAEIAATLASLTGHGAAGADYYAWVEWLGSRADIVPAAGYAEWKRALFARIDPSYGVVLAPALPRRIRLEEIVFGGARFDAIPALEDPPHVPAKDARLSDEELVFGVVRGDEARAYPHRFLSWHEMANDRLAGEPVVLSYCTLCGSGVVYSARMPDGSRERFGSSGLLYRSNKLMFDHGSRTLWNNLTGEAVVGRLAAADLRLATLPSTVSTWAAWRRAHPDTTVLWLPTEFGARWGFDYRPGAADRRRAGVAFPVWQRSSLLPPRSEVLGVRVGSSAKAYPVELAIATGVINDRVGSEFVVVIAEPGGGALRVYRRGEMEFARADDGRLRDALGRFWSESESALEPPPGSRERPLERLSATLSFWFGWFGFFPMTELYVPPSG